MKRYLIKQKFWSLGGSFDISDDQGNIEYKVEGSLIRIPKQFILIDKNGNQAATITNKMFQFLPKFDVKLIDGKEFRIRKEFSFFKPKYAIDNLELKIKGDWWNMNFSLYKGEEKVAQIHQKWMKVTSTYDIEVFDEKYSDAVISLVIAIDYVKSQAAKSANNSNNGN